MSFPLRSLVSELRDPNKGGLPPCPVKSGPALPLVYWAPIAAAGVFTLSVIITLTVSLRAGESVDEPVNAPPVTLAMRPEARPPAPGKVAVAPVTDTEPRLDPAPVLEPVPEEPFEETAASPPPAIAPAPQPRPARPTADELAVLMEELRAAQTRINREIRPGKICPDNGQCEVCEQPRPSKPGRDFYGTRVEFVRNPTEAAKIAKEEDRLTYILHVSGNFEDDGFT